MKRVKYFIVTILLMGFLMSGLSALAVLPSDANTVIAGGIMHSLAVNANGTIYVWGSNENGQLGLGAKVKAQQKPTVLKTSFTPTAVTAGGTFSAAVDARGFVHVWGAGQNGSPFWEPTRAGGLTKIIAIDAGQYRILALDSAGAVYEYTVGTDSVKKMNIPAPVVRISAGGDFFMAVDRNGTVYTWGSNSYGQLGNGSTKTGAEPKAVSGLKNIVDVAAGYTHALALDEAGSVWAWGSNAKGELGIGSTQAQATTPVQVKELAKVVSVSAGVSSSQAIASDGKAWAWGYAEYGQLGNKTLKDMNKPQKISFSMAVSQITGGYYHNLLLTPSGQVYAWGRGNGGQIGVTESGSITTPASVVNIGKTPTHHVNFLTADASSWAVAELNDLYYRNVLGLYPWKNYHANITRGEFAAILVDIYESENKSVSNQKKGNQFTDIGNSPYQERILKAASLGIVNGKSATTFDPNGFLTRQEAAKMISVFSVKMRGASNNFTNRNVSSYADAGQIDSWAAPYVAYAKTNNIMKGSDTGKFYPQNKLSKEEGLLLVARLAAKYSW